MDTTQVRLSDKQAVLLAAYLGGPVLLGVGDPYLGYLAQEIPGEWADCQGDIIRKGYGCLGQNGFALNAELENMLRICLNPLGFVLGQPMDGSSALTVFQSRSNQCVRLEWRDNQVELELCELQDKHDLLKLLEAFACYMDRETAFPPFCLPVERWEEMMHLEPGNQEKEVQRDMLTLMEQSYQRIAHIAIDAQQCTLVSKGDFTGTPPVFTSLILYTGKEGNVKARRYSLGLTDMVEVSPLSAKDFHDILGAWV